MAEKTSFTPRMGDLPVALSLLTRLPLRLPEDAYARASQAAWAYPLVGLVISALAGLSGWVSAPLGAGFAALVVLAVQAVLTGAMHEDGLADCADGFWGGWDPARRLEIMKDSQIGTYGVLALILGLAVRWWALELLISANQLLPALLGVAVMSRAGMPTLMTWLPNARNTGLSHSVGHPPVLAVLLAGFLALGVGVLTLGPTALPGAAICALLTFAVGLLSRAKIGGQTGDVLGASQQICEIGLLVTCAALVV
ncbi:adenosylcobinamide-GDP ribazoletransferase [Thalassovita sp.]|uniref:adenosylcobinamide-GDP ribazoletransferase n=1 Tax=Thalassovita sp. TaxID=1979401 RepID=UPI003B5B944E